MTFRERLAAAARRTLAGQQRLLDAWQQRYQKRGGRICCARGCSACCRISLRVTLPEALVLQEAMSPDAWPAVHASVEKLFGLAVVARDETDFLLRYREVVGACPLLAADGSCTVHADRPLHCRGLLSTMPGKYCDDGYLADLRHGSPAEWGAYLKGLDPRVNDVRIAPGTHGFVHASHVVRPAQDITHEQAAALDAAMRQELGFCVRGQLALLLTCAADARLMALAEARDRDGFVAALATLPGYHERLVSVE